MPANISIIAIPSKNSGLNPRGECVAVHARQLAFEADVGPYDEIVDHFRDA